MQHSKKIKSEIKKYVIKLPQLCKLCLQEDDCDYGSLFCIYTGVLTANCDNCVSLLGSLGSGPQYNLRPNI